MVKYQHPPLATSRARTMRREATDAERKLWLLLRDRRLDRAKFRRQVPIGPYIVDFVCLRRKLVIEADGGQHIESRRDIMRDRWLADEGYNVVRYTNIDILKNPDGVLLDVLTKLADQNCGNRVFPSPGLGSLRSPRPPSPPQGRGKGRRAPHRQLTAGKN